MSAFQPTTQSGGTSASASSKPQDSKATAGGSLANKARPRAKRHQLESRGVQRPPLGGTGTTLPSDDGSGNSTTDAFAYLDDTQLAVALAHKLHRSGFHIPRQQIEAATAAAAAQLAAQRVADGRTATAALAQDSVHPPRRAVTPVAAAMLRPFNLASRGAAHGSGSLDDEEDEWGSGEATASNGSDMKEVALSPTANVLAAARVAVAAAAPAPATPPPPPPRAVPQTRSMPPPPPPPAHRPATLAAILPSPTSAKEAVASYSWQGHASPVLTAQGHVRGGNASSVASSPRSQALMQHVAARARQGGESSSAGSAALARRQQRRTQEAQLRAVAAGSARSHHHRRRRQLADRHDHGGATSPFSSTTDTSAKRPAVSLLHARNETVAQASVVASKEAAALSKSLHVQWRHQQARATSDSSAASPGRRRLSTGAAEALSSAIKFKPVAEATGPGRSNSGERAAPVAGQAPPPLPPPPQPTLPTGPAIELVGTSASSPQVQQHSQDMSNAKLAAMLQHRLQSGQYAGEGPVPRLGLVDSDNASDATLSPWRARHESLNEVASASHRQIPGGGLLPAGGVEPALATPKRSFHGEVLPSPHRMQMSLVPPPPPPLSSIPPMVKTRPSDGYVTLTPTNSAATTYCLLRANFNLVVFV